MAKNKTIPEALLSKLHGKGSMSEILNIERDRLLRQSRQAMQDQVGAGGQAELPATQEATPATMAPALPAVALKNAPVEALLQDGSPSPSNVDAPPAAAMAVKSGQEAAPHPPVASAGQGAPEAIPGTPANTAALYQPVINSMGHLEGFSARSRVVGDDLSELGRIITHTAITVATMPKPASPETEAYYVQAVDPVLPFTAERNLLRAIRRLTLDWGTLSCQITLELLSTLSGIRNLKTIRKWLADLHDRGHICYTPIHGDLRGSIITLNPPPSVLSSIERSWQGTAGLRMPEPLPRMPIARTKS
jgi:hypothetical protein